MKRVCVIVIWTAKGRKGRFQIQKLTRRSLEAPDVPDVPEVPSFEDIMIALLDAQFKLSRDLVGAVKVDEGDEYSGEKVNHTEGSRKVE